MAWTSRDYSVAEAAQLAGLHRATLDWWVHRAKPLEVLFSERRKSRRWFSPKDIAVLRIAHELGRAGRLWNTAIAQAFERLEHPPPADALLVVPVMSVSHTAGRVLASLPDPLRDESFIVIPIGRIVGEIATACHELEAK
ncbi:MAG: MerR family transcriptional regulator [Alphaproteobacteria bacterium]|nr:MerR family transcriptional regulator [Alphaproteobacteria bacterium]